MASTQTKEEYTKAMYAILSRLAIRKKYHVEVVPGMIAQSYQEGWNSGLAKKYFNYWGMKAGSSYKGRTVAMNNKAGTDPAIYRVFTSMEDGCEGYFTFLKYSRYAPLKSCKSSEEYLQKIGPCGWNGNSGYGERCASHLAEVRKYLTSYDVDVGKPITPELISRVIAGEYGNGKARENALANEGYTYSEVRKKINELDKIGKEILPTIKNKAGEYWKCLLKLMDL